MSPDNNKPSIREAKAYYLHLINHNTFLANCPPTPPLSQH